MGEAPMPRLRGHFWFHGHSLDFGNCGYTGEDFADAVVAEGLEAGGLGGVFDLSRGGVLLDQLTDVVIDDEQFESAEAAAIAGVAASRAAAALLHPADVAAAEPLQFRGVRMIRLGTF